MQDFHLYITVITLFFLMLVVTIGLIKLFALVVIYPSQQKAEPTLGISVIICSRNDLENLKKNLPIILQQEYPTFEVIVVNDASGDGTAAFLEDPCKKHSVLKTFRIENKTSSGKKDALQLGIKNALYPFVLLTDADCSPNSTTWIKSHAAFANENQTVVLGYGGYKKEKGFLNTLIRFDTAAIARDYMSTALFKKPYMGVGRNMGYSKDLLPAFENIDRSLASGDDDLFVQAISKKSNFGVNLEKESFTTSPAKQSWKEWMVQKGRHTTTAPRYTFITKAGLMLQWLASAGSYLGIFILLLTGDFLFGTMLLLLNALYTALFNGLWFSKLGEKDLILLSPLLDFIYTFVQPIFVIKSWGRKKAEWN